MAEINKSEVKEDSPVTLANKKAAPEKNQKCILVSDGVYRYEDLEDQ